MTDPSAGAPHVPDRPGLPVYRDLVDRDVVDGLDGRNHPKDWYPANVAALCLWHCVESLRDIELLLEEVAHKYNAGKRRRRLRQLPVHLVSLSHSLGKLCNQIISSTETHSHLEPGTTKQVAELRATFANLNPTTSRSDVVVLRNKFGAHIDPELWPTSCADLLDRCEPRVLGRSLHICLHALVDLLKLDIYAWGCAGDATHVRLMTCEPFLVTFRVTSGQAPALVGLHISTSPRTRITALMGALVEKSQWMFGSHDQRIRAFREDSSAEWYTFGNAAQRWK